MRPGGSAAAWNDWTPLVAWFSRSLNRKDMKGTKGEKDPEGIETSARWT